MFHRIAVLFLLGCYLGLLLQSAQLHAREPKPPKTGKTAVLAGGCFWCTEAAFERCPGVTDVVSGYSGGTTDDPSYSTYHDGHHTECALITYHPQKVTFGGLVEWLVKHIDPTDSNGQFKDRGDGYKPIVFYETEQEKDAAQRVFDAVDAKKVFGVPIQIALQQRSKFWPAEAEHQNFHKIQSSAMRTLESESGRNEFFKKHWGKKVNVLELPGSIPEGVVSKGVVTRRTK